MPRPAESQRTRAADPTGWLFALALVLPGCGAEQTPAAAAPAAPAETTIVHNAFGMPGPWWRRGGTPEAFASDLGHCRSVSTAARNQPGTADPLDAAYRSFLECMGASGWSRGAPPSGE